MDLKFIGTIIATIAGFVAPVLIEISRTRWVGVGTQGITEAPVPESVPNLVSARATVSDGTTTGVATGVVKKPVSTNPTVPNSYDMSVHGLFFDVVRVLVRPVLTIGFFLLFSYVTISLMQYGIWVQHLPLKDVMDIVWPESTQALFSSVVAFWFGSRVVKWRKSA